MDKDNVIYLSDRESGTDPLTALLRQGAQQAIEAELQALLSQYGGQQTAEGRSAVVRNGYLPERAIQTGIGPVTIKVPKVRVKTRVIKDSFFKQFRLF
ncbi:MAG TPA: transposase, partial [Thiolinea sp.]|nr:transposase [Thiolinea sp.]